MMKGWYSEKGSDGRARRWVHPGYGLAVSHCCHPTALYPYTIDGRQDLGAFSTLEAAQLRALTL